MVLDGLCFQSPFLHAGNQRIIRKGQEWNIMEDTAGTDGVLFARY